MVSGITVSIQIRQAVNVNPAPREPTTLTTLVTHAMPAHQGGPRFKRELQYTGIVDKVSIKYYVFFRLCA